MPDAQGYEGWAGIGVQTLLGTTVARTKFTDFISESVKLEAQRKQWNNAGTTSPRVNTELARHSEGAIEVYGCFEGLESFFKAAFGDASVVSAAVSGSAIGHTFSLKKAMPTPGLTLEINRDVTGFVYEGCKVEEVEWIQDPNDYLRIRFLLRGRNEVQAAASSPTFLTPLKIHSSQLTFKAATVVTTINSFRLTLKNNMTGFRPQLGSPDSKEFIRGGKRAVTGSISLTFGDVVRYNEFRNLTDVALEFKYAGDIITGGETYQMRLNLPKINWEGETPNIGGPGPVDFNLSFTAFETTRFAQDELAFFMENTLASVT